MRNAEDNFLSIILINSIATRIKLQTETQIQSLKWKWECFLMQVSNSFSIIVCLCCSYIQHKHSFMYTYKSHSFSGNYEKTFKQFVFIVWASFDRFVDLGTARWCEGGVGVVSVSFPMCCSPIAFELWWKHIDINRTSIWSFLVFHSCVLFFFFFRPL